MDDFGRKAEVRVYISAALAHAMHFGLLQIEACGSSRIAYDGGNGEDALAANTGKYDVFFHCSYVFRS